MSTIHVKAAPNLKLPKEGSPLTYITDAEPVEVEGSHYYRKALADGDLVALSDGQWAAYLAERARAEAAAVAPASAKSAAKDPAQ